MSVKMKTSFLFVIASLACCLAAELAVENPFKALTEEWSSGKMNGKNSCSAVIDRKKYPDAWKFFYIAGGNDYKDAVLKPLNGVSPESKGATVWKNYTPILAASVKEDGSFGFPALLKNGFCIVHTKLSWGGAYSFTNPLEKTAKIYVEGHFWHNANAKIYIYVQKKDGSSKLLSDDSNPEAVLDYEKRHYLKLMLEETLEPGESLVFIGFHPGGMGKYVAGNAFTPFYISGWGDSWNPMVSLEVEQ